MATVKPKSDRNTNIGSRPVFASSTSSAGFAVVDVTPAGGTKAGVVVPVDEVVVRGGPVVGGAVGTVVSVDDVVESGTVTVVVVTSEVEVDVGSGTAVVEVVSVVGMICPEAGAAQETMPRTAPASPIATLLRRFSLRTPLRPADLITVATETLILAATGAPALARLAALATDAGYECRTEGQALVVTGTPVGGFEPFLARCATALSPAEAATTRAVVLPADPRDSSALDVLGPALTAPALGTIAARAVHARMLDALETGEGVSAAYQPLIEIRTGRTHAFEALLRLEHDGRSVPPLEVFRAAGESGRLAGADAAARHAAIRGAAGWIGPRVLFLNLLPEAIARPDDLDATEAAVAAAGLERDQVVFEASIPADGDDRHLARVLDHLRARGFGIALDDVTDARPCLALIDRVRPRVVKIDRALILELPGIQARSAVASVVGAAHAAGARVAAKGIETAGQLDAVTFVGVDDTQGWQVGQPMRAPRGAATVAS